MEVIEADSDDDIFPSASDESKEIVESKESKIIESDQSDINIESDQSEETKKIHFLCSITITLCCYHSCKQSDEQINYAFSIRYRVSL